MNKFANTQKINLVQITKTRSLKRRKYTKEDNLSSKPTTKTLPTTHLEFRSATCGSHESEIKVNDEKVRASGGAAKSKKVHYFFSILNTFTIWNIRWKEENSVSNTLLLPLNSYWKRLNPS